MTHPHRRSRRIRMLKHSRVTALSLCLLLGAGIVAAQNDPGPRGGAPGAGGAFPTLNNNELAMFATALDTFNEVQSVSGTIEPSNGLGPAFNGNSCALCHAEPAVGGTSPGLTSAINPRPNPQVALATLDGATNVVPSFITSNGPVREARFISTNPSNPFAPLDGGVHDLYTIAGRTDAPGCNLAQPDFAAELARNNVIFRIPTPLFGLGLIENTPDATLEANLAASGTAKAALGIKGKLNRSGNDGSVTKFGWKAQNKSLLIFAGEAYNVEQGVSNENFPNERSAVDGCVFNATPEDFTPVPPDVSDTGSVFSDTANFAIFMRMNAPPTPTTQSDSELNGQNLFNSTGCALCHTTSLTTARSQFTGMSNVTYHPFSDIALHHMGSNLADGVNQGAAGADEFRTAPLWGVGQRLFFLHDGRAKDLLQAIQAHFTPGNVCSYTEEFQQFRANSKTFQPLTITQACGSEANQVINNFNALTPTQKQDLLNFLRSL